MTTGPVRAALIGPLPPLRGGIAQHTAELWRALERRCELEVVPFRRIYPGWLYPGASRLEPDADARPEEAGATLDALLPWTWRTAVRRAVGHGAARVVIPWWTVAVAPALRAIARGCRRRGIPVTFVCHNVVDHEAARWKRWLARWVLREGSDFVVASEAEAERLRDLVPRADVAVHPHPVYRHLPPADRALPRRARLELLFFGFVRPYKGLDVLVDGLARIRERDWHLTVAGEPWKEQGSLRRRADDAGIGGKIEWVERYVPSAEAAALFDRADAVVLPYRHATGCGVLALALGTGTPVVASDLPGLREQVTEGETGWLVPPRDAAALAERLGALDPEELRRMGASIRDRAHRWTWDSLAATALDHER